MHSDDNDERVGPGKPPRATRFKAGQSGNPRGRPRKPKQTTFETIIGQTVTITENGRPRRVTVEEAYLRKVVAGAFNGDPGSKRTMNDLLKSRKRISGVSATSDPMAEETRSFPTILFTTYSASALDDLGILQSDAYDIERIPTWVVEMAFSRLGPSTLTAEKLENIRLNMEEPHKLDEILARLPKPWGP